MYAFGSDVQVQGRSSKGNQHSRPARNQHRRDNRQQRPVRENFMSAKMANIYCVGKLSDLTKDPLGSNRAKAADKGSMVRLDVTRHMFRRTRGYGAPGRASRGWTPEPRTCVW